MKIFLDTAVFEDIYKFNQTGLIDGVTTNPSLILKSGGDPVETIKRISGEFPFFESISAEVVAEDAHANGKSSTAVQRYAKCDYQSATDRRRFESM